MKDFQNTFKKYIFQGLFLITASLDLNLILKFDHRRNHLLFISVSYPAGWVDTFFHYLMKRPLTVQCFLRANETACYLPFILQSHWNCPTTEMMKLLQVQNKFGLKGAPAAVTAVPTQSQCCDTGQDVHLWGRSHLLSVDFVWPWVLEVSLDIVPWAHSFFRNNQSGE